MFEVKISLDHIKSGFEIYWSVIIDHNNKRAYYTDITTPSEPSEIAEGTYSIHKDGLTIFTWEE